MSELNYKVAKFGGTSVADARQIKRILSILQADHSRRIVVVSAPGKRFDGDTKVTDLLIHLANCALALEPHATEVREALAAVVQRFQEIVDELELGAATIQRIETVLQEALAEDRADPEHFIDVLKACGEDCCARLVAEAVKRYVGPATYIHPREAGLLLSAEPGNAQVLPEAYDELAKLREKSEIIVFPGFFGVTKAGKLVTFSRGGSDRYENFTDVDHVFAADPRVVPNAAPVRCLSFREMRELSYAGFGVFHDEALVPVFKAGIPVEIKNTNRPQLTGTLLYEKLEDLNAGAAAEQRPVAGIASSGSFVSINITKVLMNREIGFVRKLLSILEEEQVSFEHIPSGIDDVSVIISKRCWSDATESRVLQKIHEQLQPDSVCVTHDLAVIMLVGEGMHETIGIAARATQALATAGVNLEMINQGASEISIMFGVSLSNRDRAVKALHDEFLTTDQDTASA